MIGRRGRMLHSDKKTGKKKTSGEAGPASVLLSVFVILFSLLFHSVDARANNLSITNVNLINQDEENGTIEVQFDISWSNSWRDLTRSIDAVWVVVKWETSGVWYHAKLRGQGLNPYGKNDRADCQLDVIIPEDRTGAFIQNSDSVQGTCTDMILVWNYRENGVSDANARASTTSVTVLGLEMVYIPTGSFTAGDAANAMLSFEQGDGSSNANPTVSSEGFIRFRSGSGSTEWYYNGPTGITGLNETGDSFDLPGGFPKGYKGFYMMKTEISQGAYDSFYNSLTGTEQSRRNAGGGTSAYKATKNLKWWDLCAFCDWWALRPMTELEFEKASRGPSSVVGKEYAWGSSSKTDCAALSNSGTSSEICSTGGGNITWGGSIGTTTRVGMFAKSGNSRAQSGAGYYGNLDLSGNVWEMIVHVGSVDGRNYAGTHGDGILTTTASYQGNATNPDWPGFDTLNPTRGLESANTLYGAGRRGSSQSDSNLSGYHAQTGTRFYSVLYNYVASSFPTNEDGGRCVRTSPPVMDALWDDIKT